MNNMSMIMALSMMTSIMFTFLKHPLSMGLMLIIQTILMSILSGLLIKSFWFSYMLLITILSGTLVLFIYMASIASNEKFNSSNKMTIPIMIILIIIPMNLLLKDTIFSTIKMTKTTTNMEQTFSMINMFSVHNMTMTLLIVSFLFMTMIATSNIVNIKEGPLRMKN